MSQLLKQSLLLSIIILVLDPAMYAQLDHGIPPDPGGDPAVVPIDGGLGLLVAAGIGYGVSRIRLKRKVQRSKVES